MLGLGVLDDVRERLLDDPVENGLDLAREPGLGQARLEVRRDAGLLGEGTREPVERRHEAEVVERFRTQLDREPAHILERGHDLLS